ncbi:MAG: NupC/NupG family nucleoside CNT transporter [Bacteroidia bacterium]|nr:NupC/NupG family nucleoside CNT transporter [Bacteroidia bacterium]
MFIVRGLFGLAILIAIAFIFSKNRRSINWKLVGTGIGLQLILALLIFKVPGVDKAFGMVATGFTKLLSFTDDGAKFVFGTWPDMTKLFAVETNAAGEIVEVGHVVGFVFAFKVLPTIVFFSALTSLLYYLGILQKIVYAFAWVLSKTMKLSGAESLAAAANIFIGQTEAPLVVKPYIANMTKSEIMSLMTGGMATIAGGVFALFIGLLGGSDELLQQQFAKHLLTASILSAPAALVLAKVLVPETEEVETDLKIDKSKIGSGAIDSISVGTGEGVKLAVNVGAMLMVFIAFISLVNYLLFDLIGHYTGLNGVIADHTIYNGLNLQMILGYLFAPLAWVIGIESQDIVLAGQMLGEKTVINEVIAYFSLRDFMGGDTPQLSQKTITMMTYALCGFANFSSIGIQIGGIGGIAPNQRARLAKLGMRALLGGTLACLMTAAIAGMFFS